MRWVPLKHFCAGPAQYGLNVGADSYSVEGVRLLRTTDIQDDGRLGSADPGVFVDPALVEAKHRLMTGDLLFSRAGSLGRCYRVPSAPDPITFAGYLVRFRPHAETDPRYLEYCAAATFFRAAVEADAITSTISNFNAERYGNVRMPARSSAEQRTIADFLDAQTARIDALITTKRRMIELLNERHWRLLEDLATAGTSNASTALKHLAVVFTDGDWIESPYITTTGIRLIQTGNIGRGAFKDQGDKFISEETFFELNCTEVYPGDVLISRLANTVGQACIAPDLGCRMVTSVDVVLMRPRLGTDADYLVRYMSSERHLSRARLEARGTTMQRLARSQVGELPVPVVAPDEQRRLVEDTDRASAPLIEGVARLAKQIALLREHRQALITSAVAGGLEVPGVAA